MIIIEKIGPQTLSLDLRDQVSASDIQAVDDAVRDLLEEDGKINLLLDLTGISDVSAGAVAEDVKVETALLPHLRRFGRIAAVTDKQWIATVMRAAGNLMPGLEYQTFDPDDRLAARTFVLDEGAAPETPVPAVRFLDPPHPHVLAYEIDGVIQQSDADAVIDRLNTMMAETPGEGRRISLLVRVTNFAGFAPSMLISGPLWTAKMAAIRNLHRYALVGAGGWMESLAKLADPVTTVEMKSFDADDEDDAREWVSEGL